MRLAAGVNPGVSGRLLTEKFESVCRAVFGSGPASLSVPQRIRAMTIAVEGTTAAWASSRRVELKELAGLLDDYSNHEELVSKLLDMGIRFPPRVRRVLEQFVGLEAAE
jgi:hypothetical protein